MLTSRSFARINLSLLALVILIVYLATTFSDGANANSGASSYFAACPPGTQPLAGSKCSLLSPLSLGSNSSLDCGGNALVPSRSGTASHRSEPEVAIFLDGSKTVVIKNCIIEHFDFGVFA
jgi:hypothetical protein